jgi:hypothetical protein
MINNNGYWPYVVKKGDILRDSKGNLRVVRKVSYGLNGLPIYVSFTIKRCSWTRRPATTLIYTDLRIRGFVPTGSSVKRWTVLDQKLDKAIQDLECRNIYCWDVVGVMP